MTSVDVVMQEWLERLAAQVQNQLSGRLRDFHLKQKGHGLVLRGRARTYYAKQLAQHAIMRATDVPILHNEIEVA
jgi:hypothetical protein